MSDSEISETPLEQLLAKHRKEKKELQAKVQILKKSKGDKKKTKEVTKEIAELESELSTRHTKELAELNPVQSDNKPQYGEEKNSVLPPASEEIEDSVESLTDSLQNTKLGKAQRRREKKEHEAREREQRIKEQEKENVHGERNRETELIKNILKRHQLMIHEIPSDGNCLYLAVLHQLPVCSLAELRARVAATMLQDPVEYLPYLTSPRTHSAMTEEEFSQYCQAVATTSAWGGQVEVRALTQTLKAPIRIVQATGPALLLGEEFSGVKPLTLCYHRHMYKLGAHYNSVRPLVEDKEEEEGFAETK